jgi:hypothetical protein
MVLLVLLIAGALGWLIAETLALISGGIGIADGTLGTVALFCLAAGMFVLRTEPGMGRPGRVGIVLVSFAAMSFAMVLIITLTSGVLGAIANGEITYGAMVWTPFYLLALAFMVGGLVGLGLHYRAQAGGRVITIVFGLLTLAHLSRAFAIEAFWLHRGAGMATALVLAALGIKRLLAKRN